MHTPSKLFLMFVLVALPLRAARPQVTTVPVTLTRIDLSVALDYAERTLAASARIRVRNHRTESATQIPLQVNRLMDITRVTDANGAPLRYTQDVVRFSDWPSM